MSRWGALAPEGNEPVVVWENVGEGGRGNAVVVEDVLERRESNLGRGGRLAGEASMVIMMRVGGRERKQHPPHG